MKMFDESTTVLKREYEITGQPLIEDPRMSVRGVDVFYGDNASEDKEILLQLENSARTPHGYPVGRHSRFRAIYSSSSANGGNGWQRLRFDFVDFPDTTETVVDKIVLLFEPGLLTSNIAYYDNLDSHTTISSP